MLGTIRVKKEIVKKLKIIAIKKNKTLQDMIEEIFNNFIKGNEK
jgi:hypothetical protein